MRSKTSDATAQVYVLSRDTRVLKAAASLQQRGCDVTYSKDRLGAARAAFGCTVAVIDLESGGFAVVKDLKSSSPSTKVVMLCDRPHDRWLCDQAGADAVFVKPLQDLPGFVEKIQDLTIRSAPNSHP